MKHNTHGQKRQESSITNLFLLIFHAKENEGRGFSTLTSTRIHANGDWFIHLLHSGCCSSWCSNNLSIDINVFVLSFFYNMGFWQVLRARGVLFLFMWMLMLMTLFLRPCYYVVSQWCAHFFFMFLLLQSRIHKDGWTYLTSFWCTSCLNFPSYSMPHVLITYTCNYNYTPNNYFIWTHATHYLKTTIPVKCVRAKNPNKQLLLGTSCYSHYCITLQFKLSKQTFAYLWRQ